MEFLKSLKSGAESLWKNLFGGQQQTISPLATNQSQGFIGPLPPGSPGGAGFIGPVRPGSPDVRFPQAQPQSQGTLPQPTGQSGGSEGGAEPPPYPPNVVNQTVSWKGVTWKGNQLWQKKKNS